MATESKEYSREKKSPYPSEKIFTEPTVRAEIHDNLQAGTTDLAHFEQHWLLSQNY